MACRRRLFVEAYIANGNNASQAAIAAGTGGKQPRAEGWKLLKDPVVQDMLAARAKRVAELAGMNTENWARELRALAFSRIGDILGPGGKLRPLATLPDHVQAAIASVKATPDGTALEYKFWNKNGALTTMARHLGLFERDNAQQKSDVRIVLELLG
jgi:phage terminase small subunit